MVQGVDRQTDSNLSGSASQPFPDHGPESQAVTPLTRFLLVAPLESPGGPRGTVGPPVEEHSAGCWEWELAENGFRDSQRGPSARGADRPTSGVRPRPVLGTLCASGALG